MTSEAVPVQRLGVGDEVAGDLGAVVGEPGEPRSRRVVLVDAPVERVVARAPPLRVTTVRRRPFGLIAIASMPRLPLTVGAAPARSGLLGDMQAVRAVRIGGSSSRPVRRSAGSTDRTRHPPRGRRARSRWIDSGSMSAPVSSRSAVPSFTIGKPITTVGVAERDVVADGDRARAAPLGLEVRVDVVGADQEVARVGLVAEPVVGHRQALARLPAVDDRREALDRLRRQREGDPVDHVDVVPKNAPDGGRRRRSRRAARRGRRVGASGLRSVRCAGVATGRALRRARRPRRRRRPGRRFVWCVDDAWLLLSVETSIVRIVSAPGA